LSYENTLRALAMPGLADMGLVFDLRAGAAGAGHMGHNRMKRASIKRESRRQEQRRKARRRATWKAESDVMIVMERNGRIKHRRRVWWKMSGFMSWKWQPLAGYNLLKRQGYFTGTVRRLGMGEPMPKRTPVHFWHQPTITAPDKLIVMNARTVLG
jgi:hypothetical protein